MRIVPRTAQAIAGAMIAWLALVLAGPACTTTSTNATSAGCSLNSDCAPGHICALGACRDHCVTASDCPVAGSSCIDDGRSPVCQTPTEKNTPCGSESDCHVPLACASDYRCRNLCSSDGDCNVLGITGRVCAKDASGAHFCADPQEVMAGVITVSPPAGAPSTPVVEPDAGAGVAVPPPGVIIATSIGPAGGSIGAMGVTVTVPAGALNADLLMTIALAAQPGPSGTVGRVFDIGPTGTMFAKPITIAFDYAVAQLGGLPPSDFAVETSSTSAGASWTPLSQIVVDVAAQTIAGQTSHMSLYALVEQPGFDATVATPDSGDATTGNPPAGDSSPDGPTCTNPCTVGLVQCVAGGVQTCEAQANGCPQWVTTTPCDSHQTCTLAVVNGVRAGSCTCTASACTQNGAHCQDAATVATCAKDADGCLYVASTSSCTTPMSCSGMAPTAACALTCADSCKQGQAVCVAGGLQTCTLGTNGCWAYAAPVACGAHQTCTGAAGAAECTCNTDPACDAAGSSCTSPTTALACSTDAQGCVYETGTSTCTNGACAAGACCTNSCVPGQGSCVSGALSTCTLGANGCWAYGATDPCGVHSSCTGAPGSAACTCDSTPCSTVGTVCAGSTLDTCAKDAQNCLYVSASSSCAPAVCSGQAPDAACGCAMPFASCGDAGACSVDTSTDPNNCGSCGNVCSRNAPACCGGTCVQPLADPANCGECGVACTNGACSDGTCCTNTCTPNATQCASISTYDTCTMGGNGCYSYGTDASSCNQNELCTGAPAADPCGCAAPFSTCDVAAACTTNTTGDPFNCGGCAVQCPDDDGFPFPCQAQQCVGQCSAPYTACFGASEAASCVYTLSDPANCGGCLSPCAGSTPLCQAGECLGACTGNYTQCGLACADLTSDPTNCGACGTVCSGKTTSCQDGVCVAPPSATLTVFFQPVQECNPIAVTFTVTDTANEILGIIDTVSVTSAKVEAADAGELTLTLPTALPVGDHYDVSVTASDPTYTCLFNFESTDSLGAVQDTNPITLPPISCFQNNCPSP